MGRGALGEEWSIRDGRADPGGPGEVQRGK